jgi:hypothetical protein
MSASLPPTKLLVLQSCVEPLQRVLLEREIPTPDDLHDVVAVEQHGYRETLHEILEVVGFVPDNDVAPVPLNVLANPGLQLGRAKPPRAVGYRRSEPQKSLEIPAGWTRTCEWQGHELDVRAELPKG